MYSSRVMTPNDWSYIRYFKPNEFNHPMKMGFEFVKWLDDLRHAINLPISITSDYRDEERNRAVGGANDSAHTDVPCNAVDIGERPNPRDPNWNLTRFHIIAYAIKNRCSRIGLYSDGSIHLDMTHGERPSPRMWRKVK